MRLLEYWDIRFTELVAKFAVGNKLVCLYPFTLDLLEMMWMVPGLLGHCFR